MKLQCTAKPGESGGSHSGGPTWYQQWPKNRTLNEYCYYPAVNLAIKPRFTSHRAGWRLQNKNCLINYMNHSNIHSIMHLKNDIYPGAMDTHKLVPKGNVFKVSKWTKSINFWKCWKCLKQSRYSFAVHVLCLPQWSGYQPTVTQW